MRKEMELEPWEKEKIESLVRYEDESGKIAVYGGKPNDPYLRKLYDKLIIKAPYLLDGDEQEDIAYAFVKHVLGRELPKDLTKWWNKPIYTKNTFAGPHDGVKFWQAVRQAVPELLDEEEKDWLSVNDSVGMGGFDLICAIYHGRCRSPLVVQLILQAPK